MRIALVGYGRMGRMVHQAALLQHDEIVAIIDPFAKDECVTSPVISEQALNSCDVAIEFSQSQVAVPDMKQYALWGVNAVMGTTGWYENLAEVKASVQAGEAALIYSGNFSLGVAVFLEVVRRASALLSEIGGYDSAVFELHHKGKADSPSGTALMLASSMLESQTNKKRIECETLHRKRDEDEIQIASLRCGSFSGTHTVYFDSEVDTIELTHRAKSREGFAYGAVKAAHWIANKDKGLYALDDLMTDLLGQGEL